MPYDDGISRRHTPHIKVLWTSYKREWQLSFRAETRRRLRGQVAPSRTILQCGANRRPRVTILEIRISRYLRPYRTTSFPLVLGHLHPVQEAFDRDQQALPALSEPSYQLAKSHTGQQGMNDKIRKQFSSTEHLTRSHFLHSTVKVADTFSSHVQY